MRIAVAGGTGLLGRLVVAEAHRQGHEPVVLARSTGVDVVRGTGLDAALEGADAVVDVSNRETLDRAKATAFFTAATRQLLEAGARAGVRHHVAVSIVGVDRVAMGYYRGKRAQEEVLDASGAAWSVLRTTQFHEFPAQLAARSPGPVVAVPRMRVQPVAAAEVAEALVRLAAGAPAGHAPELAGPEQHEVVDLVRAVVRAQGRRAVVLPLALPGAGWRRMADGGLLPAAPGPRGTTSFDASAAAAAVRDAQRLG